MQWQEIVFFVGQMVFNLSLLPSIFGKDKPAFSTSLITSTTIFVYVFTYSTLSLWVTSASVFSTGVFWTILAYQKYKLNKKEKK